MVRELECITSCRPDPADAVASGQNDPPQFPEKVSQNIDKNAYDFIRPIAEGSYGDVYECLHRVSGQLVAIKRFKQAHDDPQVWRLAMRELSVLRNLPSHPNLVQLRRAVCSQSSGRLFFVFELMERSLLHELKRQPGGFIPSSSLKQVAWQLLHALAHCHQQRVIHRDIKPANVLISGGGATDLEARNPGGLTRDGGGGGDGGGPSGPRLLVKLCDFGFARWVPAWDDSQAEGSGAAAMKASHPAVSGGPYDDRPRAMSTYVTTRWYRAPEILVSGPYDAGVDVWAFGCTLAELATGRPLFPGSSTVDQLWRIMRCLGPLPPALAAKAWRNDRLTAVATPPERGRTLAQRLKGVPPPLVQLITACLTMDPSRRPSAKDLLWLPYFWDVQRLRSAVAAGAAAISSPPGAPGARRAARAAGPPPTATAVDEESSAPEETLAVPNRRIEPKARPSSAAAMPIPISASAGTGGSIIISGSGGAVSGSDASVRPLPRFATDSSLASVAAADGQMRCPWGSSQGMASRASTSWAEAEAAEAVQLDQDRGGGSSMTSTLPSAGHHAATGKGVKGVTPNAAGCRAGGLLVRAMSSRADGAGSGGIGGRGYRPGANTLLGAIDASRLLAVVAFSGLGVHRRFRSGPLSPKPRAAGINGLRARSGSSSRTGLLRFFQHQQQNHKQHGQSQQQNDKQHGQSQQQRPPRQGRERQPGDTLLLLKRQQRPPPRLQQLALAAQSEGRGSSSGAMQSAIGAFLEESVSHNSGGRLAAASVALVSAPLLRVSAPQQVAAPRVPRALKEPMSRLTYSGCKAYSAQQQLEHTWTRAASAVAATMASGTKPTCNPTGLISTVSTATLRTSQHQLSVINSPAGMTSAVHFRSSMDVARCPTAPPSPPLRRRTQAAFVEPSFVPAGAPHRAGPTASAGLLLYTSTSLVSTSCGELMTTSEMEFLSSSAAGMATGPPGHEAPLGRAMSFAAVDARTLAQRRQGGDTSSPPLPPTAASAAAAAAAVARTFSARESRRCGSMELAPAAIHTASSSQRLCEPPMTVRCIMSNPASAISSAHEALTRAPYGSLHPYNAVTPVPRVGLESVPATAGRLLAAAVSAATAGGPPPVPATNPRRASSFDRGKSRLIVRSSGDTIACRPSGVSLGGDKVKGPDVAVARAIAARERQSSGGGEGGGSGERGCGSAESSCGSGKKRGKVAGRLSRALQLLRRSYRALKAKALNGL